MISLQQKLYIYKKKNVIYISFKRIFTQQPIYLLYLQVFTEIFHHDKLFDGELYIMVILLNIRAKLLIRIHMFSEFLFIILFLDKFLDIYWSI